MSLRRTALHPAHRDAGAKMADFGGWEMPIEYPTGVVAEHQSVRTAVGIFDVSHMGKLVVRGPGAAAALNRVLVNDLDRIGAGQAQYSMLCDDDGGIIDDLIVYRVADDEVRIVPNAANARAVRDRLAASLTAPIAVADRHEEEGILAVQGPASRDLLVDIGVLDPRGALDYMAFAQSQVRGAPALVCRTGYTGEHGYELIVGVAALPWLWQELAGRATPCGLAARDTLRTEMGYPLHGQDISPDVSPLEAGLGWAVGWDKPDFIGRAALLAQREAGRPRALRGLRLSGRGVPRPGMAVVAGDPVGVVTSGTFSPTLRRGIALALLEPAIGVGAEVAVDIRGRLVPAEVVRPPFVAASPR